ncbi:multicopper oxidase domain-containing protein [Kocuria flava]|uniref:multicopper oxidase domain-containing protein n=1 Tax=Kocuria flava TaxID=446860 RepID=UPI003F194FFD
MSDLHDEPVAARRSLGMGVGGRDGGVTDSMGGPGAVLSFPINREEFDAGRTDQTVAAGSMEEWTLTNSSPMDHPMHLHVWPMQVVQDGERDLTEPLWLDVANIPVFGWVTVRVAFNDHGGPTVCHCHLLDHEDLGMVGTVEARRTYPLQFCPTTPPPGSDRGPAGRTCSS